MASQSERRTAPRLKLGKQARFLYHQDFESDGRVQNISETGAAILSDAPVKIGDIVILYPDGMGRIPGEVARLFEGGFALSFILTKYQRSSMNQRIAMAQKGLPYFHLSDNRSAVRAKYNIKTRAKLESESESFDCTIIDLSSKGCRVRCERRPEIGVSLSVGALLSVVRRHTSDGFAVEFKRIRPQQEDDVAAAAGAKTMSDNAAGDPCGDYSAESVRLLRAGSK